MRNLLDKIIVIDLESSCWSPNQQPKNETQEIIEIGLTIVDLKSLVIEEKVGIIVKPTRSTISKYCTDLTTLTQEKVDKGILFADACNLLKNKYGSKQKTWLSWGSWDRKMLETQCRESCVEYPFSLNHINLKNLFSVVYGLPKEMGMEKALDFLNLPLEGTHHVGVFDAYNTAKIFIHMMKKNR